MHFTLGMYGNGDFFDMKGVCEEFFELYGQADCAREMRIEDIETGVAKGIADKFSNDE